jgi:hypothetical protein
MISLDELILAEQQYVDGIVVTDHDHLMKVDVAEWCGPLYNENA